MKKTNSQGEKAPVRGRVLPDDACPSCGTMLLRLIQDLPGSIDSLRDHAA